MPEQRRPDRTGDEADRIDRERLEGSHQRIGSRKEQPREHESRDGAVQEEVVPLDWRADRAGDDGVNELSLMGAFREGRPVGYCMWHSVSSRPLTGDAVPAFADGRKGSLMFDHVTPLTFIRPRQQCHSRSSTWEEKTITRQ